MVHALYECKMYDDKRKFYNISPGFKNRIDLNCDELSRFSAYIYDIISTTMEIQ